MMYHTPGVLSVQDVAWFREQLDVTGWVDDRATIDAQGARIKNSQQVDMQSERYGALQQAVQTVANNSVLLFVAALPKTLSTLLFNRYQDNETYGFHVDDAVRSYLRNGWMRTDLPTTLFLSNPNDYEGGELLVNDIYGQHAVKPPADDPVLYPSSSLRCVTPVTHGVRVASLMRIRSMVRDNKNRTMLLELDKNIQSLRARHGGSNEILSLLNLYHSLLREWSEI